MTYIENIFLCLAIPMILSLFFIRGRSRSYTLFVTIGMGICLLSAYVNSFFMFFDNYFCHPYIVFFFIKATIYGWHFSFYNRYVIFMVPEI